MTGFMRDVHGGCMARLEAGKPFDGPYPQRDSVFGPVPTSDVRTSAIATLLAAPIAKSANWRTNG